MRTASSASWIGMTEATGPNISSWAMRIRFSTSAKIVGWTKIPASPMRPPPVSSPPTASVWRAAPYFLWDFTLPLQRGQAGPRVRDLRERRRDVDVAHHSLLVDADDGTLRDAGVVEDAVLLGDGAVGIEIGQQGEIDAHLLRPGALRPRIVHANSRDHHIRIIEPGLAVLYLGHLLRADAGEGGGEEHQDDVLAAVFAQGERAVPCGPQGEVRGGVAYLQRPRFVCHDTCSFWLPERPGRRISWPLMVSLSNRGIGSSPFDRLRTSGAMLFRLSPAPPPPVSAPR